MDGFKATVMGPLSEGCGAKGGQPNSYVPAQIA